MSNGMNAPACRELRQLLGVYVVGAIDAAERSVVDNHLAQCLGCREELAYLAGLPALLGKVPVAEAERINDQAIGLATEEPGGELLDSLLRRVAVSSKTRRWRGLVAVAAAAVIGVAGAATVIEATSGGAPQVAAAQTVQAVDHSTHVSALVKYARVAWGTVMRVQVTGVPAGTHCSFWAVGHDGHRWLAGTWTVGNSYGQAGWYLADARLASPQRFELTSGGRLLVSIPAS
jgi:anti-sigma factor RsiW